MDVPKLPLLHKIGYVALILTGIPLPVKGKCWVLVWVKLVISHICLTSKLLISVVALCYLLNDKLPTGENVGDEFDYYSTIWIFYYCGVFFLHLILLYKREELEYVFDVVQGIEETSVRKSNSKDSAVFMWKLFVVCVTVPGVIISAYDNNSRLLNILHFSDASRILSSLTLIFFSPVYFFAWVVFYNITAVWTTVLEFNRELVKKACEEICFEDLTLKNPSVGGNCFSIRLLHDSRREHWSGRLLRMYTTLKIFRRYTNRKLSAPVSLFIVAHAFFVPIVFYSSYQQNRQFSSSSFYGSGIFYNVFWILLFLLLPVFLKEWTKKVSRDSVLLANKAIYTGYNAQTMKRLRRFVASVNDDYPESYFKFFNLDFAMLSCIFDVTILLATIFVLHKD